MSRLLIIGGSDAGISAALRAREMDRNAEVFVLVADRFANYSSRARPAGRSTLGWDCDL